MLIHPKSHKFMSSHYALPASYHTKGTPTFVPMQLGGYWAPTSKVAGAAQPWPTSSTPPSSHHAYIQVIELSHAVTPFRWTACPRIFALATHSEAIRAKIIIEATFIASGFTRALDKGQFEPT